MTVKTKQQANGTKNVLPDENTASQKLEDEHKQLHKLLEESEARYKAIFDNAILGVY